MNIVVQNEQFISGSQPQKGGLSVTAGKMAGNNFFEIFSAVEKQNIPEFGQDMNWPVRHAGGTQFEGHNMLWANRPIGRKKSLQDFGIDPETISSGDDRKILLKLIRDLATAADGAMVDPPRLPGRTIPENSDGNSIKRGRSDAQPENPRGNQVSLTAFSEQRLAVLFQKAALGFGQANKSEPNGNVVRTLPKEARSQAAEIRTNEPKANPSKSLHGRLAETELTSVKGAGKPSVSVPAADSLQVNSAQTLFLLKKDHGRKETQQGLEKKAAVSGDPALPAGFASTGKAGALAAGFVMASPYHLLKNKPSEFGIEKRSAKRSDANEGKIDAKDKGIATILAKVKAGVTEKPGNARPVVKAQTGAALANNPVGESWLQESGHKAAEPMAGAHPPTGFMQAANPTAPEAQTTIYRLNDLQSLLQSLVTEAIERHRLQVKIDVEGIGRIRIHVLKNSDDLQVHINAGSLHAKEMIEKMVPQLQHALSQHSSNLEMSVSYEGAGREGDAESNKSDKKDVLPAYNILESAEKRDSQIIHKKYDWSNYEVIA